MSLHLPHHSQAFHDYPVFRSPFRFSLEKSHSEEIVGANTRHDSVAEDGDHYVDNILLDDKSLAELTERHGKTIITRYYRIKNIGSCTYSNIRMYKDSKDYGSLNIWV